MQPRRILLLTILIALAAYNIWRYEHLRHLRASTAPAATITTRNTADNTSPAMSVWSSFDTAATLRDAPDAQFQPALSTLRSAEASVPNPNLKANADVIENIKGCTTWLLFYRQAIHRTPVDTNWQQRSARHLDSCVRNHVDQSE
jgi:hypothetical protein